MRKKYITTEHIIHLVESDPALQEWLTYDEIVAQLQKKLPSTPNHALYGLCKRCRQSGHFDSVRLNGVWYLKYIG